jgi:hypothetical protein
MDDLMPESHFFELGGHSMLAAQLIAECERTLGAIIPLQVVFDFPVFADFVAAVLRQGDLDGPSLPRLRANNLDRAPLSVQQWQYLDLERALQLPSINNMVAVLEVGAPLSLDDLRAALAQLVRRHPALRTAVRRDGDEFVQILLPPDRAPEVACTEIDHAALPPDRRLARLRNRVLREYLVPFDTASGSLIRCQIFRNGTEPDVLVLHLHHAACDGNCIGFLLDDLAAAAVGRRLPDPPADVPGHLDYCKWQRDNEKQMYEDSRDHWRRVVRDLAEVADLAPAPGARAASYVRITAHLPAGPTHRLRTWVAAEGLTEFSTVAAAVAVAVGSVRNRTRAGIGIMIDNRNHAGLERTVGPFALSSLISVDLEAAETARSLIARVQHKHLEARRWTQLPLEALLAEPAEELAVTPAELIDVVVDFERAYRMNRPGRLPLSVGVDLSELLRLPLLGPQRTLTATVQDDERLALTMECVDDPAERASADRILAAAQQVLHHFADGPGETIEIPG